MRPWFALLVLPLLVACRIPDYQEIKTLVQVTRYVSAAGFEKEFYYRRLWAIAAADPKYSAEAKKRWAALQTALWDFESFHQSFFDITLEQNDTDLWEKPLAFYDSKAGKKLLRSFDIYYQQAGLLWKDLKEADISPERRRLVNELYFLGFDLGLEEDIARLLNPLFTEAGYKVEHGRAPDPEDGDVKALVQKNLRKELRRVRRQARMQQLEGNDFKDFFIRLTLLTDEELRIIIREQAKPENTDMSRMERIAVAESMALQTEDFLADEKP